MSSCRATNAKPLELDEFAALFWTSPGHAERVMLSVAAGVGIRQGELRSLRAADVHVGEHRPHVVIRYGTPRGATKSGKPRELPLFGVALAALRAWTPPANPLGLLFPAPHGGPRAKGKLFSNGTWAAWKRAAGITRRFPWKDLRHTCGTLLLDGDVSGRQWTKEEVQALLGHSTVKMTERYAKVTERLLRRAAEGELAVSHPQATQATADWSDIPPDVAETIEILRSRLRDLNSRPTVYETGAKRSNHDTLARLRGLCEAFLVAVVGRDPLVFRRGVALAEAALELADAPALAARRTA